MTHRISLLFFSVLISNLVTLIFPLPTAEQDTSRQHVVKNPHFIVVGAGTSGSAITTRLCEFLPHVRITLIERSSPRHPQSELNVRAARNVFDAWLDSNISDHILTRATHKLNHRLLAVSGKTLGGTSSINVGQFTFPPNGTFSEIFRIDGLSDEKALRFLHQKVLRRVKTVGIESNHSKEWLEAAKRAGIELVDQPFSHKHGSNDIAFTSVAAFDSNGRRADSFSSYDPKSVCGKRLTILQSTRVDSLIFSKLDDKKVIGVKIRGNRKIRAIHQVILAAGPYESPKLLQLSGIGPADVLRRTGIKVRHELPVGTYSISRAATAVTSAYAGEMSENNNANFHTTETLELSRQYFMEGRRIGGGVLSHRVGRSNARIKGLGEITMVTGFPLSSTFPGEQLFNKNVIRSTCVLDPSDGVYSPLSISSKDSSVPPGVEFNALRSLRERSRMVNCIQKLRQLHSQIRNISNELAPGTGEDLNRFVEDHSQNGQHFVGGCAVGKVVDRTSFGVLGLNGVSVVDASVIPRMPRGAGPMSSVYVIAEHAAEVITRRFRFRIEEAAGSESPRK